MLTKLEHELGARAMREHLQLLAQFRARYDRASRRLHGMARVHIVVGTVLAGLGVITLVGGSFTPKAIGWAAFFLVLAALQFSVGYWFLAIIRSAPSGT